MPNRLTAKQKGLAVTVVHGGGSDKITVTQNGEQIGEYGRCTNQDCHCAGRWLYWGDMLSVNEEQELGI